MKTHVIPYTENGWREHPIKDSWNNFWDYYKYETRNVGVCEISNAIQSVIMAIIAFYVIKYSFMIIPTLKAIEAYLILP